MSSRRSLVISIAGLMTALTAALTIVVQIPVPETRGYINLGDAMVMLSGALFGPVVGFVAGGLGSALADIISGYAHWAPFTFLIKGIEGLIVGVFSRRKRAYLVLIGTVIGGAEMVLGYLAVETALYGLGAALIEVPGNVFQAMFGIIVANISWKILSGRLKTF
ncbi:MAG: ECF transporter S component [Thermofilum sp.]|uniref:ECF transporter S component n=2 Tax=Thermofilum adornatum TaxID=1365176 RepID=S5ZU34_9CREN|nr:ECF transporter S component [Thermofilum adornatum]AGT34429.1 hypothetical protein N186_00155 [Thermofilum adornatum]